MTLTKKYLVTTVRLESAQTVSLELLDETSKPPNIRTVILRLTKEEYTRLELPHVGQRLNLTIEKLVEPKTA